MNKKLASWLLALCVLLIPGVVVSAATKSDYNEYKGVVDEEFEKENDPLYEKYHSKEYLNAVQNAKTFTVGASSKIKWGKGLTHDSQFAKCKKTYGIDVSKWNGKIDWKKVKGAGVDFAIIRLGYRAMASGNNTLDPWFEYNIEEADKAGLKVGVYFYTQAITEKEAKEEADFCAKKLKPYKQLIDFPIMYDIENTASDRMGKAKLDTKTRNSLCLGFCSQIEKHGYKGGVYSNKAYFNDKLTMSKIDSKYYIWLAEWKKSPTYTGKYNMWQYSDGKFKNKKIISYKIPGISGAVDLDVAYEYVPAKVKGVKYKATVHNSISVTWSKVKYADGYEIRVYDKNDKIVATKKVGSSASSGTAINLPYGTKLKVGVRAFYYFKNSKKYAYGLTSNRVEAVTSPSQITDLEQKSSTSNSITLKWGKKASAIGYKVYTYNTKTKKYTRVAVIKSNSYTLKNISVAKKYNIAVIAYRKMGKVEINSPVSKLYVGATNTSQVTGLKKGTFTSTKVALSWKKQSGVSGYQVCTYDSKGKLINRLETTKGRAVREQLKSASVYSFKVRSYIKTGSGAVAYGPYSTAVKLKTCPGQIENLRISSVTKDSVTYSWDKVPRASSYYVYLYSFKNKKYTRIEISNKKASYTWKNCKPNSSYLIKVAAVTKFGKTKIRSEISQAMSAYVKPGTVKKLSISGGRQSSAINLKWSSVKNARGYRVFIYQGNGTLIKTVDVKGASYTYKATAAGTYKFRVCARNSSTYYHSLGAMTGYKSTYVAPAKVTGIKATQVTANQASFSWNETNGVEGYRIMMYDVAAGSYKQLAVTKTNSFVLQGLSGHNTYKIKVVGYITYSGKMINGIESDVVTFTTPE